MKLRAIKAAYTVLLIIAVAMAFQSISFSDIATLVRRITFNQLCVMVFMLCAMTMISAGFWRRLLKVCSGKVVGWIKIFEQHALMSVGKYLPSGVLGIVGRHHLLAKLGVSKIGSIELFLNEQLLTVLSGFLISALFVLVGLGVSSPIFSLAALLFLTGCLLFPHFLAVCKKASLKLKSKKLVFLSQLKLAPGFYVSLLYASLAWMLQSAIFLLLLKYIVSPDLNAQQWILLLGIQCLSVLLGLLAVFAPAGIGVREAALIALGATVLPKNELLLAVVAHRLVLMCWDFIVGLLGLGVQLLKIKEAKSDSL